MASMLRLSVEDAVTEFIATFLVVFLTCLAEIKKDPEEPTNTGIVLFLALAFLTYVTQRFSMAHLNPAVSVAYYISSDIGLAKMILYIVSQMGASFAAGFIVLFFKELGNHNLGMPHIHKFPKEDVNVVHPVQGSLPLTSLLP